jgi:hypothetical protein
VKVGHRSVSQKQICFPFFWGAKQEEKTVLKLSEKLKGVPLVPNRKRTYLLLMLVVVLIGGVMFFLFMLGE